VSKTAERRYTTWPLEARKTSTGRRSIGGYAAVFNKPSQNLGGFVEEVDPAFFNDSRGKGWPHVVARFNHDDSFLLGTTAGQTLRLSVDGTGLDYTVEPPEARGDIVELVERGDIQRSSFAFVTHEDEWGVTDQNFPKRRLVAGTLVDVAPVVSPAYLDTSAGLRSLAVRVDASEEEIRALAAAGELRKLFVRTDTPSTPKPKTFGPAAVAKLLASREGPR
jgi:Escherichia/Staphylococcus phage prohead protease